MKSTTIVLALALLVTVFVAGCSSIPSPDGGDTEAARPAGQHHGTPSVIYKDTRPRPLTGYENVERPAEYKWW